MNSPDDGMPRRIDRRTPKAAKGDVERFTGEVLLERLEEAGVNLLRVTFRGGARTAIHRHDTEQWLYFLDAHGFVQHVYGEGHAQILNLVSLLRGGSTRQV